MVIIWRMSIFRDSCQSVQRLNIMMIVSCLQNASGEKERHMCGVCLCLEGEEQRRKRGTLEKKYFDNAIFSSNNC